jgi:hypothetical protein
MDFTVATTLTNSTDLIGKTADDGRLDGGAAADEVENGVALAG